MDWERAKEGSYTIELITDFRKIEDEVGLSIAKQTLLGMSCPDGPKDVSAILVKADKKGYYILAP